MKRTNTITRSVVETKEVHPMIMTVVMKMKKNTQTIMEINHMREIQPTKKPGQITMPPDPWMILLQTESEENTPVKCEMKLCLENYSSAPNSKGAWQSHQEA